MKRLSDQPRNFPRRFLAECTSISPGTASVASGGQQQFNAYVAGSCNTAATWSASAGTIGSSGLYVAPTSVGTYVVTSTSAADPTKSAAASITVAAAQSVSVSISPATVAMPEKWQQQFAATVSGSTNTAVTWTISQGTGSITQSGSSLHLRVLKSMW